MSRNKQYQDGFYNCLKIAGFCLISYILFHTFVHPPKYKYDEGTKQFTEVLYAQ